jgi:hypothetical protein
LRGLVGDLAATQIDRAARTTIDRPGFVRQLASWATSASSFSWTSWNGRNWTAWRLPSDRAGLVEGRVHARGLDGLAHGGTLCCMTQSIPAMPMADSRPPMVVESGTQAATRAPRRSGGAGAHG